MVDAPPNRNWIFVKVETDQPGLYGWGEATLEWKTRGVVGCIEDFEHIVRGHDPRDVTGLVELLNKAAFWPLGVYGLTAMSAIEQACWDIKGKDLGVPVWQLLGGKVRGKGLRPDEIPGWEEKVRKLVRRLGSGRPPLAVAALRLGAAVLPFSPASPPRANVAKGAGRRRESRPTSRRA